MAKAKSGKLVYSMGVKVYPDSRDFSKDTIKMLREARRDHVFHPRVSLEKEDKEVFEARYEAWINSLNDKTRKFALHPTVHLKLKSKEISSLREQVKEIGLRFSVAESSIPAIRERIKLLHSEGQSYASAHPIKVPVEFNQRLIKDLRKTATFINTSTQRVAAALKRLEQPRSVLIHANAELTPDARKLMELEGRKIDLQIRALEAAELKRAMQAGKTFATEMQKLTKLKTILQADPANLDKQAREMRERLIKQGFKIRIPFDINSEEAQEQLRQIKDLVKDIEGEYDIEFNGDLDKGLLEVKLKALTRPRDVSVRPKIDPKFLAVAEATLARLSGGRFAKDLATDFWDFFKDIDKHAPKIGALTVAVGGLAAGVGQLTAGTVTLGASLAKFGSFGLLAPGFLASAAIGVSTMVVAFKDADKYVGGLGKRFSGLRTTIGSNFWKNIVTPLNRVADSLLPKLNEHLAVSSRLLGGQFLLMFQQVEKTLSNGVIDTLFNNLNKSIEALSPGVQHITRAFVDLGVQGSEHLITFNTWLSRVFDNFANWVERSGQNGNFDKWIKDATEIAKQFGRTLRNAGGFLKGINTAARKAGSDGLATLERAFGRLNEAVNSERGQAFLDTFFFASRKAWDAALDGLSNFMQGVYTARDVLYSAVETAGETLKTLLTGLGEVLKNTIFQNGVKRLFNGIRDGAKILSDHADSFARVFGSLADIIGSMLPVLAEWAGLLADTVAPWLERTAGFVKQFAGWMRWLAQTWIVDWFKKLVGVFSFLAPLITTIAVGVGAWVKAVKLMDWARKTADLLGFAGALRKTAEAQAAVNAAEAAGAATAGKAGKLGKLGRFGGLLGTVGRFAGYVGLAALGATTVGYGVKNLTEWARGIDATAVSYDKLSHSIKNASNSSHAMDKIVRDWGKNGVFSVQTGEIKNLKQALETLREEDTYLSQFLQNPFWTGMDLTANNVSVLKENVANFDRVLAEMAERNLPQFQTAWENAVGKMTEVEFGELIDQMPEVKKQLEEVAAKWGLNTEKATLYDIALGGLTTTVNQWGVEILTKLTPTQQALAREMQSSKANIEKLVNYSPNLMTALDNIAQKTGLNLGPAEKLAIAQGELRVAYDENGNAIIQKVTDTSKSVEENHQRMREAQRKTVEQFPELKQAWSDLADKLGVSVSSVESLFTGRLKTWFDETSGSIKVAGSRFEDFFSQFTNGQKGYIQGIDDMVGATDTGFTDFLNTVTGSMGTYSQVRKLDEARQKAWSDANVASWEKVAGEVNRNAGNVEGRTSTMRLQMMDNLSIDLASIAGTTLGTFIAGWDSKTPDAISKAESVHSSVKDKLSVSLSSSGASVITSFADGMRSALSYAASVATSVMATIRSYFPNSPAKRGAFSGRGWVSYSGEAVGKAWAEGLRRSADLPVREAERITARTRRAIESQAFNVNTRVNHSHQHKSAGGTVVLKVGDREFTAYVDSRAETVVSAGARGSVRAMTGL